MDPNSVRGEEPELEIESLIVSDLLTLGFLQNCPILANSLCGRSPRLKSYMISMWRIIMLRRVRWMGCVVETAVYMVYIGYITMHHPLGYQIM